MLPLPSFHSKKRKAMKPIDYVLPMVFTDDEAWRRSWEEAIGRPAIDSEITPRWRSWGTEEIAVRLVLKNMPWLRYVHILLSDEGQVKPWLSKLAKGNPKVRLVFHKAFIPFRFIPTFNSTAIEMFLNQIPDLAERFIYANDDMYILKPLAPTDFFRNGKPCQHHVIRSYRENPFIPNLFMRGVFRGLNMIAADFGKHYETEYLDCGHSLSPILRSTMDAIWERHSEAIFSSITPDRSEKNMNQYIYGYWQHFTGKYVDHTPVRRYVHAGDGLEAVHNAILDPDVQVLCINDTDEASGMEKRFARVVRETLLERMNNEKEENDGKKRQ